MFYEYCIFIYNNSLWVYFLIIKINWIFKINYYLKYSSNNKILIYEEKNKNIW